MPGYDALIEINIGKVKNLSQYVSYCKLYFKPKSEEKIEDYLFKEARYNRPISIDRNKVENLKKEFPFIFSDENYKIEINEKILDENLFKFLKSNKSNDTTKDFIVTWLKDKVMIEKHFDFDSDQQIKDVELISGIIPKYEIYNYTRKLPPYSFIIRASFKLKQPYFSKDDDEFYIIQNSILKERVFKVPMIRGSSWKGSLASAFKELINEEDKFEKRKEIIDSYLRIFGTGSENIKVIEEYLKEKSKDLEKFKEKLLEFVLFELGMRIEKKFIDEIKHINSYKELQRVLNEKISEKIQKDSKNLPIEFRTHKGRAVFYPTYFDNLSLEAINPHDRRKRAGTQPIYYEVVPEGTEGILQIIYIPFDGILKENETLRCEVEKDLENILSAIEKVSQNGIGAKTKLGWGTFEFVEKCYCVKEAKERNEGIEVDKELKEKGWLKWQDCI